MLQYLINTTAIWLISLVLFDAFLRRESYHNYNRFYLLFTFLLGALLPLWQWQDASRFYSGTFQKPIEQVITAKQTIVSATTPVAASIDWQQWLVIIYLAGALVAIFLLVTDIIKMLRLYRYGKKSIVDGWTIIQTGKDHTPFSLMHLLFVSSIKQYSPEEWNMILVHEKRHTTLLHFADLLLMQAARIVFWFHPFVYVYNKRLLLVHEYQADNASAQKPQVYGTFLVEQAMLQSAPALSHSFNRSPIKNRIVMLTRRSSAASKTKMLVFVPLMLVCVFCFSKNSFSQKSAGKYPKVMPFGIEARMQHVTYGQILANPTLVCKEADCEVTEFTISFLPKGKDFQGPYTIKGSSKVQGTALKNVKILLESKNEQTRIFIENIHLKCSGKDVPIPPIIMIGTP